MRSQILHISKLLGVFLPTKVYPKDLLYDTYIYHIQLLLNCRVLALGPTCISTFCGLSGFIKRIYSYWRHLTQTRPHIFHTMTFWSLFVTIIYYNLPNFCLVIRSLSARACPLTLTNKMCMMPVHTTRLNLRPSILYILLYLFSIIEWLSSCQNVFKNKVKMIM